MVFFAPLSKSAFSLALTVGTLTLGTLPAQALPWVLDLGSEVLTNPASPLTGGFTLDDESLANPTVTSSNVMVDSFTFGAADVINVSVSGGVTAIDWLDSGNNLLSLVFSSPLTPGGGTVPLNPVVSSFTPFSSGVPVEITGSVTAVPEPLTLLGAGTAIALGGLFKRRRG
ncbi:MAG: PEP-CTERM sorting domain-containing protein [Synechocystis sp.]|nr:PEP-CTERM sorting domain-containing protein [Synechocystis sp.]